MGGSWRIAGLRCREVMREVSGTPLPQRPSGQRASPRGVRSTQAQHEGAQSGVIPINHFLFHATAGLSVIPSIFGLQLGAPQSAVDRDAEALSTDQAQQVFLSRLLLLLGCLVILCLLLF